MNKPHSRIIRKAACAIALALGLLALPHGIAPAAAQTDSLPDPRDCITHEYTNQHEAGRFTNSCSFDINAIWATASVENASACEVDPATAKTLLVRANGGTADHGNLPELWHCHQEIGQLKFFGWTARYADSDLQARYERQQSGGGGSTTAQNELNEKDEGGLTALHRAVLDGDLEAVKRLLANGADPNIKSDGLGGTPLHYAAANDYPGIYQALLAAGADPHAGDNEGNTPGHIAAKYGSQKVIHISGPINHRARNLEGLTPRDMIDGEAASMRALYDSVVSGEVIVEETITETITETTTTGGDIECNFEGDVHARNEYDQTPLHNAAQEGDVELVKCLIAAGADVNAKDNVGETPLHEAANFNSTESAKALIDAGADVNAKKDNGWTPMDVACNGGVIREVQDVIRAAGGRLIEYDRGC